MRFNIKCCFLSLSLSQLRYELDFQMNMPLISENWSIINASEVCCMSSNISITTTTSVTSQQVYRNDGLQVF